MKKYLFLLCGLFVFVISLSGQKQRNPEYEEPDKNDFDYISNQDFNHDRNGAIMLNNVFVKSVVCINLDSISDFLWIGYPFVVKGVKNQQDTIVVTHNLIDSIIVTQDPHKHPVVINGVEYTRFFNVSVDKAITLITLDEIKELYFPDVKGPYIFMVNKFFISDDLQSYRFDKDFIYLTELVESSEFENLKNSPPFSILRIFTKTRKNLSMKTLQLR
jgi:hypothetical protein